MYMQRCAPKEGMTKHTFARFWSLCLVDLHKDANVRLGKDINLFSARDLKRNNPSKDKFIFSFIFRLPMYIFESIGLTTIEVADHILATSDIAPYQSSPQTPLLPTKHQAPQPKPKRVKSLESKKTPTNIVIKGADASKKRKTKTVKSTPQVQQTLSKAHDSPVNVIDDSLNEQSDFRDIFRRKKLKLTPSQS